MDFQVWPMRLADTRLNKLRCDAAWERAASIARPPVKEMNHVTTSH
jgi:hypothetical protein